MAACACFSSVALSSTSTQAEPSSCIPHISAGLKCLLHHPFRPSLPRLLWGKHAFTLLADLAPLALGAVAPRGTPKPWARTTAHVSAGAAQGQCDSPPASDKLSMQPVALRAGQMAEAGTPQTCYGICVLAALPLGHLIIPEQRPEAKLSAVVSQIFGLSH